MPFLGQRASFLGLPDPPGSEAIAISYRSASTSRVQIRRQLGQNPKDISPGKRIRSLDQLPPVFLRDPIAARNPLSSQVPRTNFPVWSPPTILGTQADQQPSFTSTSITTTTGLALPRPLPQLDGALDITNVAQAKVPFLPYKLSRMTLRNNSPQHTLPRGLQSHELQPLQADIATSSEPQLTPTKQRIARLCRAASADGEHIDMKTIPISTSTSPRRPQKEEETARKAAQLAFHHLRHSLPRNTSQHEPKALKCTSGVQPAVSVSAGSPATTKEDRLLVTHPEPKAKTEKIGAASGRAAKHAAPRLSPGQRWPPRPVNGPLSIWQAVVRVFSEAWILVEPVFNPRSAIRKRCVEQRLSFQDMLLLLVAGLFVIGAFLITVLAARLVGMVLQALRTFGVVFRLLAGV